MNEPRALTTSTAPTRPLGMLAAAISRVTRPRAVRIFVPFAALIFVLTHWPNLQVPNPVPRTDIIVHVCVFGLWTVLAACCGLFGPVLSTRNILLTGLMAALYAAFDEGTQAFRFVHRHAGWDDFGANLLGVAAACALLFLLARAARPPQTPSP